MALTSLVVCSDAQAVQVLSRILDDLGMKVELRGDSEGAAASLEGTRFDAVVVDCQSEAAAMRLIAKIRKSGSRAAVVIALVTGANQVRDIFEQGANFLIYKPVSNERALHSLNAARALVRQERRVQPRIPLEAQTSISYPGNEDSPATLLELSESGLGMRTGSKLPPACKVYFRFSVPGNDASVRLAGEVMWQDATGRVGIRFAKVPDSSMRILRTWIQQHSTVSTENQGAQKISEPEIVKMRLPAGLGLLSASAPDRRNLSRRACTFGAEVYRGDSKVPNRCTLSDISTGGCYIETTEPFPSGSIVTVVVRTHEVHLCIAGKVQSMHPGFGMGVRFTTNSDVERKQVNQLIALAQSQPKFI